MKEEVINRLANWITIITGTVVFWNFGYSLTHGVYGTSITIPSVPSITLPFRLIVFILLETALAYVFGWLLVKVELRGRGVPMILLWVVAIISAWTSLFNIQWILIGKTPSDFELVSVYTFWFFAISVIALIVAIYLIYNHLRNEQKKHIDDPTSPLIQGVCFILMFFIYLYGN